MGEFAEAKIYSSVENIVSNYYAITRDGTYIALIREVSGKKNISIYAITWDSDAKAYSLTTKSIWASGETTQVKYEYTFEEIGIPNDAEVKCMTFGAFGYAGFSQECLLALCWTTSSQKRLSLIRFSTYSRRIDGNRKLFNPIF